MSRISPAYADMLFEFGQSIGAGPLIAPLSEEQKAQLKDKLEVLREHYDNSDNAERQIAAIEKKILELQTRIEAIGPEYKKRPAQGRRGELKLVSQRRQLLDVLKRHDEDRHKVLSLMVYGDASQTETA